MPGGRPSKLTPEVQEKLVKYIRDGNFYYTACACVGVSYPRFRAWMLKGMEAKSGKYRELYNAVLKAEAECEDRLVKQWLKQGPRDWHAIKDFLEKRSYVRWGKREKLTLETEEPLKVEISEKRSALKELLSAIAERVKDDREPDNKDSSDESKREG
ncbi:MAG: hypothetical protein ACTSPI_00955 [Candidatus Heimdallarchaeaceae archaeon]